ncbi:MAG: rhomboid family intramembrane serine protease [Bradymonadia bacterium]
MKHFWLRLAYLYYRALGASKVQAEWKVRQLAQKPERVGREFETHTARSGDRRFNCVCGQLLVAGEDKSCHRCGRRQWMPHPVRKFLRILGLGRHSDTPGTTLFFSVTMIMFCVQLKYGSGGLMRPTGWLEHYELGATSKLFVLGGQPWRAVTYTWLHGGLMHLGFNLFVLMQIGPLVERSFGTGRFLFTYVLAGVGAAVIPAMLSAGQGIPVGWTVGASGAIFGLIGLSLVFGHRVGTPEGRHVRDEMIKWTVYTTVFGLLMGGVAHGAHFAGLACGALLGGVLRPAHSSPKAGARSGFFGAAGIGFAAYSMYAWLTWLAAGTPPPAALPEQLAVELKIMLVKERGVERALDDESARLIKEVKQLVTQRASVQEWVDCRQRLLRKRNTLKLLDKELFRFLVARELREASVETQRFMSEL